MLRGNYSAKIDEKGRLKIPALFRTAIQDRYGDQVFVTSREREGVSVKIYPMPVWEEVEGKLAELPSSLTARDHFVRLVNYYGQVGEMDKQGRVSIHPRLRRSAAMVGDVDVLGQLDHLEVWNHERFSARMDTEPFTDDDARTLAELGI